MDTQSVLTVEPAIRLTESEEERCARYAHLRSWLSLAEILLPPSLLAALTLSGGAAALLQFALPSGTPAWQGHLFYLLLVGLLTRVTLLPLQYLKEHWLDRRFGVSRQSTGSWLWEWLCRSAVFGLVTVAVLFPVAEALRWWPLLAVPWCLAFMLLRNLFYDYVYHPLLAYFYPVRFLRHETFNLPGIGRTTLPVYEVKVSHKTGRANAHIRIRGKNSAIYVTDTLIDEFTDGEERVVMAHEFGHLYDQLHLESRTRAGIAQAQRKLVLGVAQLMAGAVSLLLVQLLSPALHLQGAHDLTAFPLLAALTLVLAHVFSPWICAEARRDEQDADQYALAITGDVDNYCSVMRKLRQMNLEESCPTPLGRFLFDTHPSYNERAHLARHYRYRIPQRRKSLSWRGWRNIQRHGRR